MDMPTMGELAPQIVVAFAMLGGAGWLVRFILGQLREMRAEMRKSMLPPATEIDPGDTGRLRAVGSAPYHGEPPWDRIDDKLGDLDKSIVDLGETLTEEIKESRSFREETGQRVTALETDVKWLRRGKGRDDTLGGGKS